MSSQELERRRQAADSPDLARPMIIGSGPGESRRIAIVGASAAGLFAADLLAEHGLSVRVYEASPIFDPAPRILIVTRHLCDVLGVVPEQAIVNTVSHFELFSKDVASRVSLREPDLIIDRALLLRFLAERAENAGVELVFGRKLTGIAPPSTSGSEGLHLRFQEPSSGRELQEQADVVIGADGAYSQVSRAGGMGAPERVALQQAVVKLPDDAAPDVVRVWFRPDETRFFYWLIPDGSERAALGLIADDARQAGERLRSFLCEQGLEPLDYQRAEVAQPRLSTGRWLRGNGQSVRLTGDAARQVKMTTVGGVVTGLRGAKVAAQAVLGQNGHHREAHSLRRELDLHLLIRSMLDGFTDADYNAMLASLNAGMRDVLGTRTRDEMAGGFWRLPLAQPRLLTLGARVLLRGLRRGRRSAHP